MLKAPSNIKNPVASLKGWETAKGELLKAQKHTQAECDEFNGTKPKKKAAAKPKTKKVVKKKTSSKNKPVKEKSLLSKAKDLLG